MAKETDTINAMVNRVWDEPQTGGTMRKMVLTLAIALGLSAISTVAWAQAQSSSGTSYLPVYVAMLTGFLGFVGSWMGAQIALLNFKKQRAFDKQLDWYERAAGAMHSLADKIQVAYTLEGEKTPAKLLAEKWREVQAAHRVLDRITHDSPLYANDKTIALMKTIAKKVQKVADDTEAWEPTKFDPAKDRDVLLDMMYKHSEWLEGQSKPLLQHGRSHLEIDRKPLWHSIFKSRDQNYMKVRDLESSIEE